MDPGPFQNSEEKKPQSYLKFRKKKKKAYYFNVISFAALFCLRSSTLSLLSTQCSFSFRHTTTSKVHHAQTFFFSMALIIFYLKSIL